MGFIYVPIGPGELEKERTIRSALKKGLNVSPSVIDKAIIEVRKRIPKDKTYDNYDLNTLVKNAKKYALSMKEGVVEEHKKDLFTSLAIIGVLFFLIYKK